MSNGSVGLLNNEHTKPSKENTGDYQAYEDATKAMIIAKSKKQHKTFAVHKQKMVISSHTGTANNGQRINA